MDRRDERFRGRIIEPHLSALRRAACRLCRNGADAEDLVQEVCLRAYEKLGAQQTLASPRAWFLRVLYNLHIDTERRRATVRVESLEQGHWPGAETSAMPASAGHPETDADTAALLESLTRVWPSLNADQQALLAFYAEGYSLKEITETLSPTRAI